MATPKKKKTLNQTPLKTPGVIRSDESYTRSEFARRIGVKDDAIRALRRKGLPSVRVGRCDYYRGSDWFDFLSSISGPQSEATV